MIKTFYGLDALGTPGAFLAALIIGAAFGFVLERAGFGSSRRLAAIFYGRDMTVLKVMFTAVITAMLGISYATGLGLIAAEQVYLLPSVYGAQILGGLIFGIGFVMSGWCPGTAAVGAASGRGDALVFLGGAVGGSVLFNEVYPLLASLASWGQSGESLAYSAMGMGRGAFAFLFAGVAVACFWGAEYLERRVAGTGKYLGTRFLKAFSLVVVFAAFGVLILPGQTAGGAPVRAGSSGGDERALLSAVENAHDHIEPEDLADRMMSGEKGLLVIDVRPQAEYAQFHLRGAVNVPIDKLHDYLEPRKNQGIVALYSNGMTHPAQARDSLARTGHANVYMLTDGLNGFMNSCLKPASLRAEPVPAEGAARINAWRAYFSDFRAPPAGDGRKPLSPPQTSLPGLVDTAWLAANLQNAGLAVIDVRDQKEYNGGHVPGALALNPESVRGNVEGVPSVLLPAEVLAAKLSLLGLSRTDTVVLVYGGNKVRDATLVAMALERVGHERYALLDGGWDRWAAEKRPVNTVLPSGRSTSYASKPGADRFTVDYRTVLSEMKSSTVILDVRPADAFSGKKRDEARGGHIPGAKNREFSSDLGPASSRRSFKTGTELSAEYAKLIPGRDTPVIVHCRTGHQASQTYFLLKHVLGYRNVRWYDAGWTEWASRPELPVATGQ